MCFGQEAAVGQETWMRNDSNDSSAFFGGSFRFVNDEDNDNAPACLASASSSSASRSSPHIPHGTNVCQLQDEMSVVV